jgi:hypothetical protein
MKPIAPDLVDLLFGCWHKNLSFPVHVRQGQRASLAARRAGTYIVCLDCGKEFAYNGQDTRIVHWQFGKTLRHLAERIKRALPRARQRDYRANK